MTATIQKCDAPTPKSLRRAASQLEREQRRAKKYEKDRKRHDRQVARDREAGLTALRRVAKGKDATAAVQAAQTLLSR